MLWDFRILAKFISTFGHCLKFPFTLQGLWLQMKHSCWQQNWRVRNLYVLSVSWQIGHCRDGDRLSWHTPGFRKPRWNKQFSFLLCDGWMKRGWLHWWLEGVSQTTEQKEKHREEKQSHLTSLGRLLLKFRSRYSLPEVCQIVIWQSWVAKALPFSKWYEKMYNPNLTV